MSLYEGMFLMDNRQANRDWDGSLEKLTGILAKHGATVVRSLKWGEHKLAYEIKKRRRGTYVLVYFEAAEDAVSDIHRECELSELVHRALVLKIGKLPSEEEMHAHSDAGGRVRHRKPTTWSAAVPERPPAKAGAGARATAKTPKTEESSGGAKAEAGAEEATPKPEPENVE